MTTERMRTTVPPPSLVLDEACFGRFQKLIEQEVGIFLAPTKKDLVVARLSRRLRDLRLPSFDAYWDRVASRDDAERREMIDCICTNETHFFREPAHFAFLEDRVFPDWVARGARGERSRGIRVWSAGCSTGEEPFSLAMALLRRFPPGSGWSISIIASDVSSRALETARRALYSRSRAAEIPADVARAFTAPDPRDPTGESVLLSPLVRNLVEFVPLNLNAPIHPGFGVFDLVFCRNVLIYFHPDRRRAVIDKLLVHLGEDGHLFLGHAESLLGMTDRVHCAGPTIYVHSRTSRHVRST